MNDKLLINYAFATALYVEKRNFLETFSPFVLNSLYRLNKYSKENEINQDLQNKDDLKLPYNTLKSILNFLAKEGFVNVIDEKSRERKIHISDSGKSNVDEFLTREDTIKRKHVKFYKSLNDYLLKKEFAIDWEELKIKTQNFLIQNLKELAIYTSENQISKLSSRPKDNTFSSLLIDFICEIEGSEQELYMTFEELVKGSIVWEHISNRDELLGERSFESLTIYLDSNFLFSLLGLSHEVFTEAAEQLVNLLMPQREITLKVLTITLEEMGRVFNSYKNQTIKYNSNIPVNSLFYFLQKNGYDSTKIDYLISNLDKVVESKGIIVEEYKGNSFDKFMADEKEIYYRIYSFKKQYNDQQIESEQKSEKAINLSAIHDAQIIFYVQNKRGSWVKSLERARTIFLTSSYSLDYFSKKEHIEDKKFPEVILDLTLTNILWLKNPQKTVGIQLHKLIAAHSKRFLIDNAIWTKFVTTLKTAFRKDKITKEEYAILFSSNQLTVDYLKTKEIDEINIGSIVELSKRLEQVNASKNERLHDLNLEIDDKNQEIQSKNELIKSQTSELKERDKSLSVLSTENNILQTQVLESSKKAESLDDLRKQLIELKYESNKKNWIESEFDKVCYEIKSKTKRMFLGIGSGLVFLFFAEVFEELNSNMHWVDWNPFIFMGIKCISFILFEFIFARLNEIDFKDIWSYYLKFHSFKKQMVEKLSNEYLIETPPIQKRVILADENNNFK